MPQGVEHMYGRQSLRGRVVRIPLMPQGVEHQLWPAASRPRVRIPLMPQGVEHLAALCLAYAAVREDSIDAARR